MQNHKHASNHKVSAYTMLRINKNVWRTNIRTYKCMTMMTLLEEMAAIGLILEMLGAVVTPPFDHIDDFIERRNVECELIFSPHKTCRMFSHSIPSCA